MTTERSEATRSQPTATEIRDAILYFPGPLLTFRLFKQYGPRAFRSVLNTEYDMAIEKLQTDNIGNNVTITIANQRQQQKVFVKKTPEDLPENAQLDLNKYREKFNMPVHRSITQNMRNALVAGNHVNEQIFTR